jgi:hypothetical protein
MLKEVALSTVCIHRKTQGNTGYFWKNLRIKRKKANPLFKGLP